MISNEENTKIYKLELNNTLKLYVFCTYKITKMIVIEVYELGDLVYRSSLTPMEMGSILTTSDSVGYGDRLIETVLSDTYLISRNEGIITWNINNRIEIRLTDENLEGLFDIFTKLLSIEKSDK